MSKYGWDYDTAYKEMKNYNFSSGLVHGALKSYVKDYASRVKSGQNVPKYIAASTAAATAN
jgi:hypothetical protein